MPRDPERARHPAPAPGQPAAAPHGTSDVALRNDDAEPREDSSQESLDATPPVDVEARRVGADRRVAQPAEHDRADGSVRDLSASDDAESDDAESDDAESDDAAFDDAEPDAARGEDPDSEDADADGSAQDAAGERALASPAADALRERIARLPAEPGVYLFRDAAGAVLYVGKAQSLRARVRSYFNRGGDGRIRMHFLVPRIRDVEVVATHNVKEALLLENQLIKEHKPRFNVRLRDDKTYLALRIDPRAEYPRFSETRRFRRDGALYFGPYTSSQSMRQTLRALQRIFPLRTCSDNVFASYQRRGRPCLEHSLGRCVAPCCGRVSSPDYAELVSGAVRFMKGQSADLLGDLETRMNAAADALAFETAARLRDRIQAIERTLERQATVTPNRVDRDCFAIARAGRRVEIQSLHVRQGRLMGGMTHPFTNVRLTDEEVLDSFLSQYYDRDTEWPQEVLVPVPIESAAALEALWSERAGRAVRVAVPQRGERRRLLEMAQRNADLALAERTRRERGADEMLAEVGRLLGLAAAPVRIECYDTSHLRGTLHVGSRVVFRHGEPDRDGYRRYKLREAPPGDDYAALREILARRLARRDEDLLPDLLLLDGGKGQLAAVRALCLDLALRELPLASIAKERDLTGGSPRVLRHGGLKREQIFLPHMKDPLAPPADSPALLLLQRIRDESHRFAIRYHRELRRKMAQRSILDELPGIGPAKRRALLRALGSLDALRSASEPELAAVPLITSRDASVIAAFFAAPVSPHPEEPADEA
jgi:excinuclease ABC subunit C